MSWQEKAGIPITQVDIGGKSATRLDGIPPELADRTIATRYDIESLIEELYPYYGFTRSETLVYVDETEAMGQKQYLFREFIDGIETSEFVSVYVNSQTRQIAEIRGEPQIKRDLGRMPRLSESEALDLVIGFTRDNQLINAEVYDFNGSHSVDIVYRNWGRDRALVPFWHISLALSDGVPEGLIAPNFYVAPNGEVQTDQISNFTQ